MEETIKNKYGRRKRKQNRQLVHFHDHKMTNNILCFIGEQESPDYE